MRTLLAALLTAGSLFAASNPSAVTFNKQVLPLLQKRCQSCHRAGEAAPFSMLTYKDARPWAKAMKEAVLTKKMPPWFADPAYGHFSNDRRLAPEEVNTLVSWVDQGALEGEPKDAPPPLDFTDGWTIGKPDVVLEMPVEYVVPAKGTIEYTYFLLPKVFSEDKWIEKIEVRPGARSVVHHVVMVARPPGSKWLEDMKPGVAWVPPKDKDDGKREADTGEGAFLLGDIEMVSVYVPGGLAYQTGPGQARLMKAGSDLIFQMHYTANGKQTADRSRVGIVFAKEAPRERVVNTFIKNTRFRIPPGASDQVVDARVTVHQDATLLNLFPHMHLRGKAFEYQVKYPTGETETLLRVPRYDFNWQLTYELEKPLNLPKGTVITAVAHYDNSPNNPYNPDPKSEVYWGDQSWDEMLAGFVDFAIPLNMDPNELAGPKKDKDKGKEQQKASGQ
ncbi:MAG: thiol-disulfide isomerase [Acidobacteriia bacterium]|nr:thiol-disulfide isomerase [Terriglobia bacterium]